MHIMAKNFMQCLTNSTREMWLLTFGKRDAEIIQVNSVSTLSGGMLFLEHCSSRRSSFPNHILNEDNKFKEDRAPSALEESDHHCEAIW